MTDERMKQIQEFAEEKGLPFVDAKKMLEEIENEDDSFYDNMRECWY